jgi:hypothetical protein
VLEPHSRIEVRWQYSSILFTYILLITVTGHDALTDYLPLHAW